MDDDSDSVRVMCGKIVPANATDVMLIEDTYYCYLTVKKYRRVWATVPRGATFDTLTQFLRFFSEALYRAQSRSSYLAEHLALEIARLKVDPTIARSLICQPTTGHLSAAEVEADRNLLHNSLTCIIDIIVQLLLANGGKDLKYYHSKVPLMYTSEQRLLDCFQELEEKMKEI